MNDVNDFSYVVVTVRFNHSESFASLIFKSLSGEDVSVFDYFELP